MNALKKNQVAVYFFEDLTGGVPLKIDGIEIDVTVNVGVRRTSKGLEVDHVEIFETSVVTNSGACLKFEKQSLNRNKAFYAELSEAIDTLAVWRSSLLAESKWTIEEYE